MLFSLLDQAAESPTMCHHCFTSCQAHCGGTRLMVGPKIKGMREECIVSLLVTIWEMDACKPESFRNLNKIMFIYGPSPLGTISPLELGWRWFWVRITVFLQECGQTGTCLLPFFPRSPQWGCTNFPCFINRFPNILAWFRLTIYKCTSYNNCLVKKLLS